MSDTPPVEAVRAEEDAEISLLPQDSYTAERLRHAKPEHLHLTTRRCFIGPIPEGWLKSHRSDWYKRHLHIHYSSRAATFSASSNVGRHRRMSGLDGPSATAAYGHSFPQPEDVDDDNEDGGEGNAEVTTEIPPAIPIPRAAHTSEEPAKDSGVENGPKIRPIHRHTRTDSTNSQRSRTTIREQKSPKKTRPTEQLLGQNGIKSASSFHTAREELSIIPASSHEEVVERSAPERPIEDAESRRSSNFAPASSRTDASPQLEPLNRTSSTASLLSHRKKPDEPPAAAQDGENWREDRYCGATAAYQATDAVNEDDSRGDHRNTPNKKTTTGLVRFNVPEDPVEAEQQVKVRMAQMKKRDTIKRLRKQKVKAGMVIKVEKMLVRVEFTLNEMPRDYDENGSQKIELRTLEKWKEYIVACRETDDDDVEYFLQLYKTRVIPMREKRHVKKKSGHEIPLDHKKVKINLFSSLDKTMVIWMPWKKGTIIYVMKPRSSANSMEWYTFLKNVLGWNRASVLHVHVPDLSVGLILEKPFEKLESVRDLAQAADGDDEAIERTMKEEQRAAGTIIDRCMGMLDQSPDWGEIANTWADAQHIGLAWKRYDRLEWIHGVNEMKMYGTIAMERSHELELRPRQHYPTTVTSSPGKALTEPAPVEGFLIRLTSQRGAEKRLGRLFFKRLYFSTHNQFLVFNRPARADPPPPPQLPMRRDSRAPSVQQIIDSIPLIYSVTPFPLKDGAIEWLQPGNPGTVQHRERHDQDAYDENERKINLLLRCDGNINLCNVVKVRNVHRGVLPIDDDLESGPDVDFHESVADRIGIDGTTKVFDDARTFELVLRNSLVIRLQAYDQETKREWMKRLRDLVTYWKLRTAGDTTLYKSVRKQNLELLGIDEPTEAFMGQFAHKWEVTKSYASAELYNMCGISCCRTIHMSGVLYRKPRLHGVFSRSLVILSHGNILIFQDSLRAASGRLVPHIHHEKIATIDLRDCYVYSGLITEPDLLNSSNRTFDASHPGHHALPRMYLEDGWSSTDEDTMTCFVLWHGKRHSWFRSEDADDAPEHARRRRLKHLSKLGVTGRSIVFKARSRAERDHWVLSIGVEIERLGQSEDLRLVDKV